MWILYYKDNIRIDDKEERELVKRWTLFTVVPGVKSAFLPDYKCSIEIILYQILRLSNYVKIKG